MKKLFIPFTIITLLAAGCQKYVDIRTKGQLVPSETDNYRYLMNNFSSLNIGDGYSDWATDDIDLVDAVQQTGISTYEPFGNIYTWSEKLFTSGSQDYNWNGMYNIIYICNTVTEGVMDSNNGSQADKNQIYAEALVHRANAYLSLVRSYSKAYDAATAGTDLGVPLLLKPETEGNFPRASVQAVYDRILGDLAASIPLIKVSARNNYMPTKAAAYGLMARVCLDMGNYTAAAAWADSSLALKSTLLDYNTLSQSLPRNIENPEILLSKNSNTKSAWAPTVLRLSDELTGLLGTEDLRYKILTADAAGFAGPGYTGRMYMPDYYYSYPEARNSGINIPEVMLIRAECLARNGNAAGALTLVNELRRYRFAPADYQPLAAANADAALRVVLEERRRELCCRGFRWADLKRLNKEARFEKTITRNFNGKVYTLAPRSNWYALPIADYYFTFNTSLVQNPR